MFTFNRCLLLNTLYVAQALRLSRLSNEAEWRLAQAQDRGEPQGVLSEFVKVNSMKLVVSVTLKHALGT